MPFSEVNLLQQLLISLPPSQHFYNDINQETMELVHLILQTLIEMCVGNFPNQEVLYNRLIVDVLNTILELSIGDEDDRNFEYIENVCHWMTRTVVIFSPCSPQLVNLKGSAVELIEAMLEETNSRSRPLAKEIAGSLNLAAVHDTMGDFYELMNDPNVIEATYDDEAECGLFRAYHIIVHLKDYGNDLGEWGEYLHHHRMCCSGGFLYQLSLLKNRRLW